MMGLNNGLSPPPMVLATRFWHERFASTFSDTWRIDNEEFLLAHLLPFNGGVVTFPLPPLARALSARPADTV